MADNLDDGEFWLPSHFLTDDDFLFPNQNHHSKGLGLSSSPQSTLSPQLREAEGEGEDSSQGSPHPPVSPPPADGSDGGATWDLLHKAAGEVALIKIRTEKEKEKATGTGFFDCSNVKRPLCPPKTNPAFYSQPQVQPFFPPYSHQIRNNSGKRALGFGWPPIQAQNQPIRVGPPLFMDQIGPKRESVGTGVFLPRRVATAAEIRKKSEGNSRKMRSGKGSQPQQRRNSRPPMANPIEIQLPQEWTY